jgi:hypothetical protein
VTTITGRFKDSGGLIHWAWNEGAEGRDYRASRDKAAEAGSICHGWIEDWIHGVPVDVSNLSDPLWIQAAKGYLAFQEWADQVKLEILETEVPLVSEQYKFGGTFDALALVAGTPKLLDWKTSNAVYAEYVAQLAAYRQLIWERGDAHPHSYPQSAQLLRVGKEHADFHVHSYPESVLDIGWSYFKRAREMYDLDKELRKVAA